MRLCCVALALASAVAAQSAAELVAQGREAMWHASRREEARGRFEAALLLPKSPEASWHRPLAMVGLASLSRSEGEIAQALDHLAQARAATARWPTDQPFPSLVLFDLRVESCRVFLATGLVDRAAWELEAAAAVAGLDGSARRVALELARIDLALAAGDARSGRRSLDAARRQIALDPLDAGEASLRPLQARELELREAILRRRELRGEAGALECAQDLERMSLAAEKGSAHRARLGSEAVAAFLLAGRRDSALALSRQLCEPPFESPQRRAEAEAQRLSLLLEADAPREDKEAAHEALSRSMRDMSHRWRAQPLRKGGVGVFHYEARRNALDALLRADLALSPKTPLLAMQHLEDALSLGTLTRRLSPQAAQVDAGTSLPSGVGALAYAFSTDAAHVLLLDGDGCWHHRVDLDEMDRDALRAIAAETSTMPGSSQGADHARLASLAAKLLPPDSRLQMARWRCVLMVGDEAWAPAWHAMPFGERPLGIALPCVHSPSFTLFAALRARAASRPPITKDGLRLALVADPELSKEARSKWNVDDLALTPRQIEALRGGHPGPDARVSTRSSATVDVLLDPAMARAAQWTIVAHGAEDLRFERSVGVLLAGPQGGALLDADAVESLRTAPLVVLGVCGAAGGTRRLGDDGIHHLGGAFVAAGADRVLLSGGELAVGATVDLIADFTSRVREGAFAAEALRAAREEVRSTPGRERPFYWAGLRLLGLP